MQKFGVFLGKRIKYELISEGGVQVIRCSTCFNYINDPVASAALPRKPSIVQGSSLITGLMISDDDYKLYNNGGSQKWYNFKNRLLNHVTDASQTNAQRHAKNMVSVSARKMTVVRNQLRTAIGIVQSKSAAIHYETRIAELHNAGDDVSRVLFPQMIRVACSYIDRETQQFLSTDLPNTVLPPHFYVTADKSTNHRQSNQATLICPVIDGKRTGIQLGLSRVYTSSDGSGGWGNELAASIFSELKSQAKVDEMRLLLVQGKVTDGQYINFPFTNEMNEPIFKIIRKNCDEENKKILLQDIWWECQWDPGHLLDKVFSKFHDSEVITRLLGRVALFHQLFRHGKMHSLAKVTAKELKLPFFVTNSYAPQRFMSSCYLSLTNLQRSYETYAETFKDHHNQPDILYKLCGNDFVYDLCGIIDLLWPIVVLMLKAQQEWSPGWSFPEYVKRVKTQLRAVEQEIMKSTPSQFVCPLLNKHGKDITNFKYGNTKLVEGWILQGKSAGEGEHNYQWKAREIKDYRNDLNSLATGMINELDERFTLSRQRSITYFLPALM